MTVKKFGAAAVVAATLTLSAALSLPMPGDHTVTEEDTSNVSDWPAYGGQAGQQHYSSLSQINRRNVKTLRFAWSFDTGEKASLETTPVVVGGIL